ncbi:MAG: tRNA (adenosine(37)-N6)-threonylcarbamoyltransferase complex dimerization subunit type 1 TsaB [Dehalococcoidia bacterium]|nr:MAG: tRNA (adenosine(37)-N6)-threonylcarbamoyltransferase complex dimerization subunit type 1 TsaB [Dehalococcoidia bacterium]
MYLAIDTSTDNASLAIIERGLILAELNWFSRQNHSVELMPNLNQLLDETKTNLKSTEGIIVAIGPGSFNGLRVGLSTAKGLAFSIGVPLVGINTLESTAYQYQECEIPICPIFNAGRGEIATAIYQYQKDKWLTIIDQQITTIDKLIMHITKKTIFCGEPTTADIEKLKGQLEQKAKIASPASRLRRAAFLAELGIKRIEAGNHDTPANLQPIYLRQPPITQPKNPVKIIKTSQ